MRLYIKGDYTKEIPFDYLELAKRMWFDTKDGKRVDFSYFGNTRPFKTDPTIHLKLNKWMHDNRWNTDCINCSDNSSVRPETTELKPYIRVEFMITCK